MDEPRPVNSEGEGVDAMMAEDMIARARQEQEEHERRINEIMENAGNALREKMRSDPELNRMAYMMLFSNRLFNWALSEVCALPGMTTEMVNILVKAQQQRAAEGFEFAAMIKDLQDRQMPWLESRRKEALMRKNKREKRLKEFTQSIRKKNIDLPCHSMEALFENTFTHNDTLVVVGERRAVAPILQLCARKYTRAGGHAVLLSSNETATKKEHIAKDIIRPAVWRNAAAIYGDLQYLLSGFSKTTKPMGLLVVEDLDNLLMSSPVMQSRPQYLLRSYGLLQQYQADYGGAMILGVLTDEDPEGIDRLHVYPPDILARHVFVSWQEPKVSDIPSIVVGNDILLLSEIEKELKEPE